MKNKWRMPHPATMFLLLTIAVVFLSWICDIYGLKVTLPQTGEEIRVQSLLSPEGIRWWLRNAIKNFTGFAPLGMVIIAMVRTGGCPAFRIYWCMHPFGSGEPEGEKEGYLVGNRSWLVVQRYWRWRIYYLIAYCRHAVPMGRTSSACRNYYGLCFSGMRI